MTTSTLPTRAECDEMIKVCNHHGRIATNPYDFTDSISRGLIWTRLLATFEQVNASSAEVESVLAVQPPDRATLKVRALLAEEES